MSLLKEKLELKVEEAEFATQRIFFGLSNSAKWALIIILLGILPSYFISKFISGQVWNGKLKALTITSKTSFVAAQDLVLKPVLLTAYEDGSFGAAAEIINPNQDLSVSNLSYSWKFFDALGQKLQPLNPVEVNGTAFVLPKSTKYLVVPKIQTQSPITKAELAFEQPIKWQKRLSLPNIGLATSPGIAGQQLSPLTFSIDSKILNNSPYKIKEVRIVFLVFDQNQKLKAVSQRLEYDLLPYEKRAFKQLWPQLYLTSADIKIFAETNTLDQNNFSLVQTKNNSSDLSRPTDQSNPFGF